MYYPEYRAPRRASVLIPILAGVLFVALVTAFLLLRSAPTAAQLPVDLQEPTPPLAGWRVRIQGEVPALGNQRFSGWVKPGQTLFVPAGTSFSVMPEPPQAGGMFHENRGSASWDHEGGELNPAQKNESGAWRQDCVAPQQQGLYHLIWRETGENPRMLSALQVLVVAPSEHSRSGERILVKVNGKSIGAYTDASKAPVKRVRENAHLYQPPQFFTTLNPASEKLQLGPDFDLAQLVAFKDYYGPDGKKVYTTERHTDVLPPRPELIEKLNKLRQRLREKGVKVTRFWVTSGFRTPEYNRSIKGAMFSRHCYGDAVDIVIDENNDKHMDDLNGDGRIDRKDGIIIGNACRELELEGAVVVGGIGVYEWDGEESVRSHVHIDCRGYVSRWGQDGSGKYRKSFTWWPKSEFSEDDGGD